MQNFLKKINKTPYFLTKKVEIWASKAGYDADLIKKNERDTPLQAYLFGFYKLAARCLKIIVGHNGELQMI